MQGEMGRGEQDWEGMTQILCHWVTLGQAKGLSGQRSLSQSIPVSTPNSSSSDSSANPSCESWAMTQFQTWGCFGPAAGEQMGGKSSIFWDLPVPHHHCVLQEVKNMNPLLSFLYWQENITAGHQRQSSFCHPRRGIHQTILSIWVTVK